MRYLYSALIAIAAMVVFAPGAVHAQSPGPLEDIVTVGAFVQYEVTANQAGTRFTQNLSGVMCPSGQKMIGVVMTENITLPTWSGTGYWDLSIYTDYSDDTVIHSETSSGGRTVTVSESLHARSYLIVNWSIMMDMALLPEYISTAINYPVGTNMAMPVSDVDYSVPEAVHMHGVGNVSIIYNADAGGQVMTATGKIAPVCINDPDYYYIGSAVNMTNYNDDAVADNIWSKVVVSPVNVDLNGTSRLLAVLADVDRSITPIKQNDFTYRMALRYTGDQYGRLLNQAWYEGGVPAIDNPHSCIASGLSDHTIRVWNSDGVQVFVRPCLIPEASGYVESTTPQYFFRLDPYNIINYTIEGFETEARHVAGTGEAVIYPVIVGQGPEQTATSCSDRYQIGSLVRTDSVPSYDAAPFLAGGQYGESIALQAGQYYAIEIVEPPWLQGDSHPAANSYLSQFTTQWMPGPTGSAQWFDPANFPNSCVEELDHGKVRIYFYTDQTAYAPLYGIRAADPAGDWSNNQLDLNYAVYNAVYTPRESECAANFDVGNLIGENLQVRADREEGGFLIPGAHQWQPNETYMIEISGEPWYDDGDTPSHEIDVSIDGGVTWVNIDDLIGEFCVSQAGFGRRIWYLTHVTGRSYKLRAHDEPDTYLANSGNITYSVYTATNYSEDGNCSESFTIGSQLAASSIPANLEEGDQLSMALIPDQWYAIETVSPPWLENGVPSGDADISADNYAGRGWTNLLDFPGGSCSETTDIYQRVYFRAQYENYWLRAGGEDYVWTDHTEALNYKIYSVSIADPQNPPPASCEEAYNQQRVLLSVNKIFSNDPLGTPFRGLEDGLYAIESLDGPWFNGADISYDLAYNQDGEIYAMIPTNYSGPVECVVLLSDQKHVRAYVNVTQGDPLSPEGVSVYDPGDLWTDNSGTISYAIYKITREGEDPPMPDQPPVSTCESVCVRPDGILEIPSWLEYGRCQFSKFITFCPYHTEALSSLLDAFNSREPFKTFNQIADLPKTIQEEFEAYAWDNPSGGAEQLQAPSGVGAAWYDILPNLPADSPWNGGKISIIKPMSTVYSQMCNIELKTVLGSRMSGSVCFILNVMNGIGAIKWMQFILDLSMLVILVMYIDRAWLKQGG